MGTPSTLKKGDSKMAAILASLHRARAVSGEGAIHRPELGASTVADSPAHFTNPTVSQNPSTRRARRAAEEDILDGMPNFMT